MGDKYEDKPMAEHRERKLPRLAGYDYSHNGAYFVTICTHKREPLFGEIIDGNMQLNHAGEIVLACWNDLAKYYVQAEYDGFVIMPNHIHAIIILMGSDEPQSSVGKGLRSFQAPPHANVSRKSAWPAPNRGIVEIIFSTAH